MGGHASWEKVRREFLAVPENRGLYEAARARQARVYNRPWWRLMRWIDRVRGR